MFRRIDDDGSKSIQYSEFRKGIEDTGLDLTEEGYKDMFVRFDKDGSGAVSIDEFLYSVRPPMSDARKRVIGEAYSKLDKS